MTTDPEAIGQHLAWCEHRGLRPGTLVKRRWHLERMRAQLAELPLPTTLLDVTSTALREWQVSLTSGPEARAAAINHARSFYRWTAEVELTTANLLVHLTPPRRPNHLPRPIATQDLADALDGAPDRIRPWLLLAALAGLRACEVAPLRAEDLTLNGKPPTLLVADGKGGKQRVVPLHPRLVAELQGTPRRGWLFPALNRFGQPIGGHVSASQVSHLSSKYLRTIGPSSFHALRHRFATDFWAASLDLRMLQEMLGHADPRTSAGYAALVPGKAASVVAQLGASYHPALTR